MATEGQTALLPQAMFGLSERGVKKDPCQGKGKEGGLSHDRFYASLVVNSNSENHYHLDQVANLDEQAVSCGPPCL